jgi:hypothetical protein
MARYKSAKKAAAGRKTVEVLGEDKKLLQAAEDAKLSGGLWRPEVKGDTIAGEVLAMAEKKGKFGVQNLVTIDTGKSGVRAVYANIVMQRGLDEKAVKVGDRIAIQYRGTAPSGKGRPCKLFAVVKAGGKR